MLMWLVAEPISARGYAGKIRGELSTYTNTKIVIDGAQEEELGLKMAKQPT